MSYSNKWLRFSQSAEELFTSRYELQQDKEAMVSDLKQALVRAHDRQTALELLVYLYPDVTVLMPLLDELLAIAIDSGNLTAIGLAREVLSKYQAESWVRINIPLGVKSYLADHDEWHYRRIAELYKLLGYEEELTSFLLLCQASPNEEIQEISDDFSHS